jgi:hypothetical protein
MTEYLMPRALRSSSGRALQWCQPRSSYAIETELERRGVEL